MTGRGAVIVFLIAAAPMVASAASLPIEGNYGDKAGCHFAKDGIASNEEDFILLTRDYVRSAVSLCEFRKIEKTTSKAVSVTLSCADEGEEGQTSLGASVIRTGKDSYRVDFNDATSWGPFKRCK